MHSIIPMNRIRRAIFGVVLLASFSLGTGHADPVADAAAGESRVAEQPVRADIVARLIPLLSGFEFVPTKDDLLRAGTAEELVVALSSIYRDPDVRLPARLHALSSLRFFPTDAAADLLADVVRSAESLPVARRSAVRVYAHVRGEASVTLLGEALEHSDRHTREAAVRALREVATPGARDLVTSRSIRESDSTVKTTILRLLEDWK